jgi:predicted nucleotidyltransferase
MGSDLVTVLRGFFEQRSEPIVAAYLYGSEARGTAGPNSDIDVAILFGKRPAGTLSAQPYGIEDELRGLVRRPVQVIALDTAPPDLAHRVLRDGLLLHERDRATRIRFEVAARNAYFDVKPFLDRYRRTA